VILMAPGLASQRASIPNMSALLALFEGTVSSNSILSHQHLVGGPTAGLALKALPDFWR